MTLNSGSEVTRGHRKWYHVYKLYGFLLVFCVNIVPNSHGSVSVFNVGIGIRYFCRYLFKSVRYSVSVFQNIAISVRYFGISAGPL